MPTVTLVLDKPVVTGEYLVVDIPQPRGIARESLSLVIDGTDIDTTTVAFALSTKNSAIHVYNMTDDHWEAGLHVTLTWKELR